MSTRPADTNSEIERLCIEGLRQMPSWRKLALMADTGQSVRVLALAGLLLGPELAARVYGPLEEFGRLL